MYQQRGATMIGWMFVLGMIAVVTLLVLRIAPVYMESLTVKSVVEDIGEDVELRGASTAEIMKRLQNRFRINDVASVKRDNVSFEKVGEGTKVMVNYESRFPIVANLDGVATFSFETLVRN